MENLQYPIGKFTKGKSYSLTETQKNIESFSAFPKQLESLVKNWDDKILAVTYRDGGWNGRQVINHLGDSHAQLILRFKSCLTDENAQVKPYDEDAWAKLHDSLKGDILPSLQIINGVHARLSGLLKTLNENDFLKTIYHPESKHTFALSELVAMYAWHGQHHLAHLKIIEQNSKLSTNH